MQMSICKANFVLTRPKNDERNSCNDFPKTPFFLTLAKYLVGFAILATY